jgi:type IV fimbrial biogenesis protein FimT
MEALDLSHTKGFTLIEAMVTFSVAVSIYLLIVPYLQITLDRARAKEGSENIRQLLAFARVQAILYQSDTVVCPLSAHGNCITDWNLALTVFRDQNSNLLLDSSDEILRILPKEKTHGHRQFNNKAIRFNSKGLSGFKAGSMSYCYSNRYTGGISLIISRIGRIRSGIDSNNDGLPELANGKNIPCN